MLTKNYKQPITVDIKSFMEMTGLGRNKCIEIGKKAGAVIRLSSRRTLYNVEKIKLYMDSITEESELRHSESERKELTQGGVEYDK